MKPKGTGYLAGRMTGLPNYGYDEFHSAARILRESHYSIHNPAEHFGGDQSLSRSEYIRRAMLAVMVCDYVVVLPGWEESPGANLEVDLAIELGMPVYQYNSRTGWASLIELEPRPTRTTADRVAVL
jgi:hypothetical protein